jgi:predicted dehydrogenase (TIGR03970 family)
VSESFIGTFLLLALGCAQGQTIGMGCQKKGVPVRASAAERVGRPDVLVVGAGAAGCALAARLSEDPDRSVLLLEAGPGGLGAGSGLQDARLVPGAQPDCPAVAWLPVRLTPSRPWSVPRGRVLGGSTAVNGGYFVRARRTDFDRWAAAENPAWAYPRVLPLLRRLEHDLDFGPSELHGGDGPMTVRRPRLDAHPSAAAFRDAALAAGHRADPDKNDPEAPPGIGPVPGNAVDGVRRNAALGYLTPEVLARPNLRLMTDRRVLRVLVERGRATGVLLERTGTGAGPGAGAGAQEQMRAGEVVLSTGALATPHLLQLSGIGPREVLEPLGLPVVLDAPAVGARLSDHPQVVLSGPPAPNGAGQPADSWLGGCLHLATPDGDLELLQSLLPMNALMAGQIPTGAAGPLPYLLSASPQARPAAGRLRPSSVHPDDPPLIEYDYLTDPQQRRLLRYGVRAAVEILTKLAPAAAAEPGPRALASDPALDRWIAEHLGTSQHTCGTVPMGPAGGDPARAAVDQYGSLHGLRGLRVADTSILPDAPHRGPAATAVLIGELVAEAIRAGLEP